MNAETAKKMTDAMERLMCQHCTQYETGCKPKEIIDCTQFFCLWFTKATVEDIRNPPNPPYPNAGV